MRLSRRNALGAAVALGVFALGAPIADASVFSPFPFVGPTNVIGQGNSPTGCQANFPVGVGFAGGTVAQTCASVLSYTSPAIGQIAYVGGGILNGAQVLAPVVTTAGAATF
jgi:hypothetical protein